MTTEEITHLLTTLPKKMYNKTDELWKRAFIEYGSDNGKRLNMGCGNCYFKVYSHIKQKYS